MKSSAKQGSCEQARYWIGVASKEHVDLGIKQGIAQFNHGKLPPLKRLNKGDWVIYYSPKDKFQSTEPYRKFTAIGTVDDDGPYQVEMTPHFKPFRRRVKYLPCQPQEIAPLIVNLPFIKDKQHWGGVFRFGFLEIDAVSFKRLAMALLGYDPCQ